MNQKRHGDAYKAVRHIYDFSPGRSWQRLNGALSRRYPPPSSRTYPSKRTISAICRDMKGGYWMGNSTGSECGEHFYTLAVDVGHIPACIAFEKYAERPAALWAEEVKTPKRLAIGARFTWKGFSVTVTNLRPNHLIACAYASERGESGKTKPGDFDYFDGSYRKISTIERKSSGDVSVTFGPPMEQPSAKPSKIFKIEYSELAATRKEMDRKRKVILEEIAATENREQLSELTKRYSKVDRLAYRRCDLEILSAAIGARHAAFKEAAA